MEKELDDSKKFPAVVYKYRDWGYKPDPSKEDYPHQRMLKEGELWMASPASFNDPFDCRITTDFQLLTEDERKSWVNRAAINGFQYAIANNINLETKISEMDRRMDDISTFQRESENLEFEEINRYGILSLSCRWDSILMWSHYANNHQGFCVGFHEAKLRNSGLFGSAKKVDYGDRFPSIHPLDEDFTKKHFHQTYVKANDWEYEEEYRLFKADYDNSFPDGSWRKVIVPWDCIAEVVLGLRIDGNHQAEILEFCASKQIPAFQTKQVPREFRIIRVKIA